MLMLVYDFHFCYVLQDNKLLASSFPLSTGVAYILSLGVTSSFRSRGVGELHFPIFLLIQLCKYAPASFLSGHQINTVFHAQVIKKLRFVVKWFS